MEEESKSRLFDLTIVLSVAFLPAIIKSIYVVAGGTMKYSPDQLDITFFIGSIQSLLSILLLFYVLFNRNKTFKDLGIGISLREIFYGFGLAVLTSFIFTASSNILHAILPVSYSHELSAKNVSFLYERFSWFLVIYIIVNPFFEEMIVRGFAMTEIFSFTNRKVLTIAISTGIQTAYHLYQGPIHAMLLATIFLSYSIFYFKTGKLTPVIIAHLIFDLAILTRIK